MGARLHACLIRNHDHWFDDPSLCHTDYPPVETASGVVPTAPLVDLQTIAGITGSTYISTYTQFAS
jgi:hypothetical protein